MYFDFQLVSLVWLSISFGILFVGLIIVQDCDFTLFFYFWFNRNKKSYDGKVIWIVGASSGIGEQIAYQLATQRCKLVLTATSSDKLIEVKKNCLAKSKDKMNEADILIASFDITEPNDRHFHFNRVIQVFGKIDILINNAGRTHVTLFEQDDRIESLFACNFFAQLHLSRMVLSHWSQTQFQGQIAVTSSLLNYFPMPYIHTYSASKRAIHGLYESLRLEYYPKGVHFTICCPGPVSTEIYAKSWIQSEKGHRFRSYLDMRADRCAKLMTIAIANQLNETWIARQPILYLTYLCTSFPTIYTIILKWVSPILLSLIRKSFFELE